MTFVLISIMAIGIVAFAAAVCIVSDRLEQRRGLNRLRKRMLLESDFSDQQFATAFSESDAADALEMRQMLAVMLGIDAVKIRPEWRFREERALRNLDYPICHAFALRYAPASLRDQRTFVFPTRKVTTVRDLFVEALSLQKGA